MIWTIAKREVVTRGRSKGFLAITGILFLGVIAMAILLTVLGGDDDAREVTIGIEGDGAAFADLLAIGDDDLAPTIVTPDDGQLAVLRDVADQENHATRLFGPSHQTGRRLA